ncbi:MAG: SDR family NAD(P)-dependent oxidoreductase [Candidatus Binatia bacterium]
MGKLDGKIALITGSSRGIGRAIALEFARQGAHIAVNYRRDATAAAATVQAIEELGQSALAVQADVSEWPAVRSMADTAVQHFGHIDIVVANSGIASRVAPLWDLSPDHWHKVININLHGVFYTCRATVGHLVERRSGNVLLISSVGADMCGPMGAPYYVAKAGVNALAKSLAKECAAAGVRVNCIAPGLVATDMGDRMMKFYGDALVQSIPLGRPGQPEDIGKAAVYLASDDASFVTGKILRVDGGAWM